MCSHHLEDRFRQESWKDAKPKGSLSEDQSLRGVLVPP